MRRLLHRLAAGGGSAGIKKLMPCAGEGSNGARVPMLPVGSEPRRNAPYAPMGAPRISSPLRPIPARWR